jgi:hypothetical protein
MKLMSMVPHQKDRGDFITPKDPLLPLGAGIVGSFKGRCKPEMVRLSKMIYNLGNR